MFQRLLAIGGILLLLTGCPSDAGEEDAGDGAVTDAQPVDSATDTTDDTGGEGPSACGERTNFVKVRRPDVYFVFDRSESMEGMKMSQAKQGLDTVADLLADRARIGLAGFPLECCCSSQELLELGAHDAATIKDAYGDLGAAGGTPTGIALFQLRQGERLDDPGDAHAAKRSRAVVLVTDGEPNDEEICDETVKDPVEQARMIAQGESGRATPVYVVGFQSEGDPATLDAIAEAGGTDAPGDRRFYSVGDGSELADTIEEIAQRDVACSRTLEGDVPEGASLRVKLGGEQVPNDSSNGVTLEQATGTVRFHGDWCEKLQQQADEGATLGIRVTCPDCVPSGESCDSDGECCRGECRNGTCTTGCQPNGAQCTRNADCCSSTCSLGGDDIGQCIGS